MSAPMILGVDPGKSGALAWVQAGRLVHVEDMPDVSGAALGAQLSCYLIGSNVDVAVVEQVHSMPGQGVASTFKFGVNYGVILGVLGALSIPVVHVTPASWKKSLRLSRDKTASRQRAVETWPQQCDLFARVKDDGRAEAALIALHHYLAKEK